MTSLFSPTQAGALALANRIAMAPLTRNRADAERCPTALTTLYYTQRASAGLLITEASQISPEGQGYLDTPGIYSEAQVAAWRRVTDAVHAAGGRIVIQLWHVGRISHTSLLPAGMVPVSSTDRRAEAKTFTAQGFEDVSTPRPLRTDELPRIVADYRHAARNAIRAGFDGVEIHGANNYLLEQFLRSSINNRGDAYGGPIHQRARLVLEVVRAVAEEIGAERTGIRLSPVTPVNGGAQDSDAQALYQHVVDQLAPLKLAFIHVIEGQTGGARDIAPFDFEALRRSYKANNPGGAWIVNNGYTREMALEAVDAGRADLVAFGRPFISNPDLVQRLRDNAPLAPLDRNTLYGGDAVGYTDYPTIGATAEA
jgi:N-ethylmaleimide reductase